MRIAVSGSQGQVVRSLLECAPRFGAKIFTLARPDFDLADPRTIMPAVEAVAPDIIVNAAAYTAVDKAETEEKLAHQINAAGAGILAQAAERLGIPIIQISTDYVFDGSLERPYREDDRTGPLNAYGRSKLRGEEAVRNAAARHVILRTSWAYSPFGTNFVRTMLRLGETRDEVAVVADQIGCPTSALDIADGILSMCKRLKNDPDQQNLFGTFHLAGLDSASWADFAEAVFVAAARFGRRKVAILRITTQQYPTLAKRPANSRLESRKLADTYGISLPSWKNSFLPIVERVLRNS